MLCHNISYNYDILVAMSHPMISTETPKHPETPPEERPAAKIDPRRAWKASTCREGKVHPAVVRQVTSLKCHTIIEYDDILKGTNCMIYWYHF